MPDPPEYEIMFRLLVKEFVTEYFKVGARGGCRARGVAPERGLTVTEVNFFDAISVSKSGRGAVDGDLSGADAKAHAHRNWKFRRTGAAAWPPGNRENRKVPAGPGATNGLFKPASGAKERVYLLSPKVPPQRSELSHS